MTDTRRKDVEWSITDAAGMVPTWERVGIAVLMDIRDELKRLNAAIYCQNFLAIPHTLKRISHNTAKPKAKRKARGAR